MRGAPGMSRRGAAGIEVPDPMPVPESNRLFQSRIAHPKLGSNSHPWATSAAERAVPTPEQLPGRASIPLASRCDGSWRTMGQQCPQPPDPPQLHCQRGWRKCPILHLCSLRVVFCLEEGSVSGGRGDVVLPLSPPFNLSLKAATQSSSTWLRKPCP